MAQFEDALVELLIQHNCVIVPNFGGFVARQSSAKIDHAKGVISPPKKSLLFNRSLINNDGLLINHFATSSSISYQESEIALKEKVKQWHKVLSEGQRVELDKIGMLYLDEEKNIHFEQDRYTNLLLESYGLESVHFVGSDEIKLLEKREVRGSCNLSFNTTEIEIQKETTEAPLISIPKKSKTSNLIKYAAAAAFLPFAFYTYWIPIKSPVLDSGIISLNDFNPNYQHKSGKYTTDTLQMNRANKVSTESLDQKLSALPEEVSIYYYKFDDDLYIPVSLKNSDEKEFVIEGDEDKEAHRSRQSMGEWIIGAFGDATNAKQLCDELKQQGFSSKILKTSTLIRVSAGAPKNQEQLNQLKAKTDALNLDGWLLK